MPPKMTITPVGSTGDGSSSMPPKLRPLVLALRQARDRAEAKQRAQALTEAIWLSRPRELDCRQAFTWALVELIVAAPASGNGSEAAP